MKFGYFLRSVVLLALASCKFSLALCPCENAATGAVWGNFLGTDQCVSSCGTVEQTRERVCVVSHLTNTSTVLCIITTACSAAITCQGEWSTWANQGGCIPTSCGSGKQNQTRACYKIGQPGLINDFCPGGNRQSRQQKVVDCRTRRGCHSGSFVTPRITPTTTTTTSTIATTAPKTTTSPLTTMSPSSDTTTPVSPTTALPTESEEKTTQEVQQTQTVDGKNSGAEGGVNENDPEDQESLGEVSVITLGIALGSVAFVCTVVVIVVIVVFKRKQPRKMQLNSEQPVIENNNKLKQFENDNHDYEVVGPALPPSRQKEAFAAKTTLETPMTMPNVLYSSKRGDAVYTADGVYLKPISSPSKSNNQESKEKKDREDFSDGNYVTVNELMSNNYNNKSFV